MNWKIVIKLNDTLLNIGTMNSVVQCTDNVKQDVCRDVIPTNISNTTLEEERLYLILLH